MTVIFRDAAPTLADAARLARIGAETFVATFGHLYAATDLDAFLTENHSEAAAHAFLAKPGYAARFAYAAASDDPAGYVMVCPADLPHLDPALPALELKRLYLLPGHFGQGIADGLMDWTVAVAGERSIAVLALSVFSENHRALRFYQRHGFASVGSYKFRVGTQLDEEFVYVKRLA